MVWGLENGAMSELQVRCGSSGSSQRNKNCCREPESVNASSATPSGFRFHCSVKPISFISCPVPFGVLKCVITERMTGLLPQFWTLAARGFAFSFFLSI